MSSLYNEDNEEKKFKITRGTIILGAIILAVIIVLIIVILSINKSKKSKYTTDDFTKLEKRMEEEAPIYISQKNMELTEEEIKIKLKDMLTTNGGSINPKKTIAANVCDGYVVAKKNESESYKAYIKCDPYYTTSGYVSNDKSNNKTTTKKQNDNQKPDIILIGDEQIILNVGDKFEDPGAKATDNVDGDLTALIKVDGKIDTTKPGDYVLTYSVVDKAGNKNTKQRKIKVVSVTTTTTQIKTTTQVKDITTNNTTTTKRNAITEKKTTTKKVATNPPTITLKGEKSITLNVGASYDEPGYSASDSLGKDITSKVKVSSNVNTSLAGTYFVSYSVTDDYGNSSGSSRVVTVKSNYIALSGITLTPNDITLKKGSTTTLNVNFSPKNASNKSISWSSSNPKVATINNGTVTAKSKGVTIITVKGANGKSAKTRVTVN